MDEDLHVGGGHVVWVWFQLGLDIENECGTGCGEQTGPILNSMHSVQSRRRTTHEDEGRVQVFVVFPRVLSVKLVRLFAIHGKEVGARVVRSQWFEELFQGGMEAEMRGYSLAESTVIE